MSTDATCSAVYCTSTDELHERISVPHGRTGCEGRISCLKHRFGWDRTRMDGLQGARIWCGHGVFAHNLVKIGGLLEARHSKAA